MTIPYADQANAEPNTWINYWKINYYLKFTWQEFVFHHHAYVITHFENVWTKNVALSFRNTQHISRLGNSWTHFHLDQVLSGDYGPHMNVVRGPFKSVLLYFCHGFKLFTFKKCFFSNLRVYFHHLPFKLSRYEKTSQCEIISLIDSNNNNNK